MLRLGECDLALAGGVSESIHTFGIFASFHSQGALARHDDPTKASRPFDADRNGIVVAEGGCMFVLERLADAQARGAKIYGEVAGYAMNSDATDFVLPNPERQAECMRLALRRRRPRRRPTSTSSARTPPAPPAATSRSAEALRRVFARRRPHAVQQHQELHRPRHGGRRGPGTGRQPARLRRRRLPRHDQPRPPRPRVRSCRAWWPTSRGKSAGCGRILNNSFGMLGINSVVIVRRV